MKSWPFAILALALLISCRNTQPEASGGIFDDNTMGNNQELNGGSSPGTGSELATFGGGCFWCTEAVYRELKGVLTVTSGYSGGSIKNPTYKEVCSGTTGHAECIQIQYNPDQVSYEQLLEVFFKTHDPTTLNRQGADIGTQYRSVIFYHSESQRNTATQLIAQLNKEGAYPSPVVTEVVPFTQFYPAEEYHQDYYRNNSKEGYCVYVIQPKLDKFRSAFQNLLKSPVR